ncbi:MAG: SseB family protein [Bdellovibrionota bacterium]|jgi:hypothetical protein
MDQKTAAQNETTQLEGAMDAASLGSMEAAANFYSILINTFVYVPHRFQEQPLSDSPTYPNPFLNILGVQDKERVVVPVFSNSEYIEEWCGMPLSFDKVRGAVLLGRMPKDWWIAVNSGQNVEKELSPWEIDILRGGASGIPAIIEELEASIAQMPLTITPLPKNSEQSLKECLEKLAKQNASIKRLFLGVEDVAQTKPSELPLPLQKEDEETTAETTPHPTTQNTAAHSKDDILSAERVLIGVETDNLDSKARTTLREEIINHTAPLFIGRELPKIFISNSDSEISLLGMFQHIEPCYEKTPEKCWIKNLFSKFKTTAQNPN